MTKKVEYLKTITGPRFLFQGQDLPRFSKLSFGTGLTVNTDKFNQQHDLSIDPLYLQELLSSIDISFGQSGNFQTELLPTQITSSVVGLFGTGSYNNSLGEGFNLVETTFLVREGTSQNDFLNYGKIKSSVTVVSGTINNAQHQTIFSEESDSFSNAVEVSFEEDVSTLRFYLTNSYTSAIEFTIWQTTKNITV